jgi:hypothetical protein
MGFIFRNSLRAGPFRITFNKSGVGSSTGVPGFRGTQSSREEVPGNFEAAAPAS